MKNSDSAFSYFCTADISLSFRLKISPFKSTETHQNTAWYHSVLRALASSKKTPRQLTMLVITVGSKVSADCFVGLNPREVKLAEDHGDV